MDLKPVVGQLAELKSGGPKMTVAKYTPASPPQQTGVPGTPPVEESVDCWWFDDNDKCTLHKASFPPLALTFDEIEEDAPAKKKKSGEH